jgi:peptidoglycan/xylan/chitin deacetylase (PgdA/CDA1 family)
VRNADLLHQAVMAGVYPGAVLILHEGGPKRDYVLPLLEELIPDLLAQGYSFLTVSHLQALQRNSPPPPDARHP